MSSYGTDYTPTFLSAVSCDSSDYLTIFQCSFSTDRNCTNSYDATVYCCESHSS